MTLNDLNKLVKNILISDKKRNDKIQEFLTAFVESFNTELTYNATPLSTLVKGLKKTDAALVKQWFSEVTNAKLYLNNKENYVVKYNLATDTQLQTTDKFTTLKWYDLAKKAEVQFKDYYKDLEEAKKRVLSTFEKAFNTCKDPSERDILINFIKEQIKE